jgi:hypothetical protein
MKRDKQSLLEAWALERLAHGELYSRPITNHIDEILPGLAPAQWLPATLDAMVQLGDLLRKAPGIHLLACVPLEGYSVTLETNFPSWDAVVFQKGEESPSLSH